MFSVTNAGFGILRGDSGVGLKLDTNGSNTRMTILSDGDIGIGTTSPSEKLEVDGNIRATGDIIANRYVVSSSVTNLTQSFSSGSTIFGDTPADDTHQFTGSVSISGSTGLKVIGSSAAGVENFNVNDVFMVRKTHNGADNPLVKISTAAYGLFIGHSQNYPNISHGMLDVANYYASHANLRLFTNTSQTKNPFQIYKPDGSNNSDLSSYEEIFSVDPSGSIDAGMANNNTHHRFTGSVEISGSVNDITLRSDGTIYTGGGLAKVFGSGVVEARSTFQFGTNSTNGVLKNSSTAGNITISPGTTSGKLILQSADETALTINKTHLTASGNISTSGDGIFDNIKVQNGSNSDLAIKFPGSNPTGIRYNGTSFIFQRESTGTAVSLGVNSIGFGGGGNSKISAVTNTSVTVRGGTTDTVFNTTGITTEGSISASGAINTLSHITASGNISAFTGTGSFGAVTTTGTISSSGKLISDGLTLGDGATLKGPTTFTIFSDFTNRGRIDLFGGSSNGQTQIRMYAGNADFQLMRNIGAKLTGSLDMTGSINMSGDGHITSSGNISASGDATGHMFGGGFEIRRTDDKRVLQYNNSADVVDYNPNGVSTGGFRFRGDNVTNLMFVDTADDEIQIGGSLKTSSHITASGDISGSLTSTGSFGVVTAGSVGSATQPAVGFKTSGGNTGMFSSNGTDRIDFTIGGTNEAVLSTSGFRFGQSAFAPFIGLEKSETAPKYTFDTDTNTGMGRVAADKLGLYAGGVHALELTASAGNAMILLGDDEKVGLTRNSSEWLLLRAGGATKWSLKNTGVIESFAGGFAPQLKFSSGTATNPVYAFAGDSNTGMSSFSPGDGLALIAGGVTGLVVSESNSATRVGIGNGLLNPSNTLEVSGSVNISGNGHITASGNISASGDLIVGGSTTLVVIQQMVLSIL